MKKQVPEKPSLPTPVMTVKELSDYLRVHPSTIYRLLKRRQIPAFRIDGDWRFHLAAIEKWRSEMEIGRHAKERQQA
jgi:excisionase family DNA binding protein